MATEVKKPVPKKYPKIVMVGDVLKFKYPDRTDVYNIHDPEFQVQSSKQEGGGELMRIVITGIKIPD